MNLIQLTFKMAAQDGQSESKRQPGASSGINRPYHYGPNRLRGHSMLNLATETVQPRSTVLERRLSDHVDSHTDILEESFDWLSRGINSIRVLMPSRQLSDVSGYNRV